MIHTCSRTLVTSLLNNAKTKQVFAFEQITWSELRDYADWAIDCMHNGLDSEVIETIAAYALEDSINYFELKDRLRRLLDEIGIIPPTGVYAVKLYCIGCLEEVALEAKDQSYMLQHISDLLDPVETFQEFNDVIALKTMFWSDQADYSIQDIHAEFKNLANKLINSFHISLDKNCHKLEIKITQEEKNKETDKI